MKNSHQQTTFSQKNEFVIDFGQILSGYTEIRLKGRKGEEFPIENVGDDTSFTAIAVYPESKRAFSFICDNEEPIFICKQ